MFFSYRYEITWYDFTTEVLKALSHPLLSPKEEEYLRHGSLALRVPLCLCGEYLYQDIVYNR